MPSQLHEMLLLLFRNRPALAPELLREALHVELPAYSEVRLESAELNVVPAEYRADLVVLLVDGKPVLGIVVEVQLQPDARKRFTWPVYVTGLRARLECPCCLLVVTASDKTAQWAQEPIALGPGAQLVPLAVAPAGVPIITDPERAKLDPAVLSVMAHGRGDVETAVKIALSAAQGTAALDEDTRVLYFDLIEAALGEAVRKAFEMLPQTTSFRDRHSRKKLCRFAMSPKALYDSITPPKYSVLWMVISIVLPKLWKLAPPLTWVLVLGIAFWLAKSRNPSVTVRFMPAS